MYPGREDFQLDSLLPWRSIIIRGWFITIIASVISLVASIVLGFCLYLLTNSKILVFKYLGDIFNEVIFGSPLVVFLIVIYYFIGVPLNLDNRFIIGVIGLSMYMAPYMKNVFEGAMESIDELQYQAMTVFGFTTFQKYRYIIIPQLLKILIPPLAGNLTFIVKGSSLLNFIGVKELYNQLTTAQSNTYAVVEGYLVMFIMYLLITIPLIRLTKYFEKRVATWN
ncbi:MAG: ABC transporter permease subunit [Bacilli bacterium]|nr:ABC transporter permease subunit [Bacilli bacterium]